MKLLGLILILLFQVGFCGISSASVLLIESIPDGLLAWADGRYLGRTPLTVTLPSGEASLRLAEASGTLFRAPAVDTLINLVEAETLTVSFRVGRQVTVRSEPFGLPVMQNGVRIGTTPIHMRIYPERVGSLELLTSDGSITVPIDTLSKHRDWVWKGDPLSVPSQRLSEQGRWRRIGRYLMPVLAVAMASGGLIMEHEADRAYDRYLRTADPEEIKERYDEAKLRDGWATTFWIGAEVSLAAAVIAWILPERGSPADKGTGQ